jgi:amino acid permease
VSILDISHEKGYWVNRIRRYTSVAAFPILYCGWKLVHKTRIHPPGNVDLKQDLEEIEEYSQNYVPKSSRYDILRVTYQRLKYLGSSLTSAVILSTSG